MSGAHAIWMNITSRICWLLWNLTEPVDSKENCFCWHNMSHSAWLWWWRANNLDKRESTSKVCMCRVSTQQWPSTQITLFERTCQSAWLDALTTLLTRRKWILVYYNTSFWRELSKKVEQPTKSPRNTLSSRFESSAAKFCGSDYFDWKVSRKIFRLTPHNQNHAAQVWLLDSFELILGQRFWEVVSFTALVQAISLLSIHSA